MASPLYLSLLAGPVVAVPVHKPLIDAFVSAEITESATGPSGFQLTFTLADESILQTFFLLAASAPLPLLRVILVATFGGLPQVLMDGIIEHHEVQPDATGGSSKLVVTGHDLTSVMNLIPLTGLPYPGMSPDLRVELILAKYAVFGMIPEVIPVPTPDIPVPIQQIGWVGLWIAAGLSPFALVPEVRQFYDGCILLSGSISNGASVLAAQAMGTDLAYLNQLAGDAGYVFYITPGPLPGANQAYWGPQIRLGLPQPALNVNMDAWTNVESLTFTYQPQASVLPIVFIQDPVAGVTVPVPIPPVTPFNPPLGVVVPTPQKIVQLQDTAKRSPAEALMLGVAEAVKNADVVTGNGTLDVDRYGQILRARSLVGVRGAGIPFDGMHYVESVTHSVKPGQYKQTFVLKRNALIANLPAVPALPY